MFGKKTHKKHRWTFRILGIISLLILWDVVWPFMGVNQILPWSLRGTLSRNNHNTVLVDVRTKWEYDWFHIPGAVHMPELLLNPKQIPIRFAGKNVVLICMTGHRSPVTAYRLNSLDGIQASNLTWGMLGWIMSFGKVT